MKQILIISLVLIFLLACEDENPVAPKNIIINDSLYISYVNPEYGIPSQLIQILGKGFGNDTNQTKVFFAETPSKIYQINDSSISAKIPYIDSGFVSISVKRNNLTAKSLKQFQVKNLTITAIEPNRIISGGEIKINLTNYLSIKTAEVYINSIYSKIITKESDYLIVKVPNLSPGYYDIKVVSNGQTATSEQQLEIIDPLLMNTIVIKNVYPIKVSPGDSLFVSIINYGAKESEINFQLGAYKTEIINFTDTFVTLRIPSNLSNTKYSLTVSGVKFSNTYPEQITFSKSIYNIIKTELWFKNFICEVHRVENVIEFLGHSYNIDTTYTIVTSSVYFLLDKSIVPNGILVVDYSNKDTIRISKFPKDVGNAAYFDCIINKTNHELSDVAVRNYYCLSYGNPMESTDARFKIDNANYFINDINQFESNFSTNELQSRKFSFTSSWSYNYTQSHDSDRRSSTIKFIGLTDSSSVRIILTPE